MPKSGPPVSREINLDKELLLVEKRKQNEYLISWWGIEVKTMENIKREQSLNGFNDIALLRLIVYSDASNPVLPRSKQIPQEYEYQEHLSVEAIIMDECVMRL